MNDFEETKDKEIVLELSLEVVKQGNMAPI